MRQLASGRDASVQRRAGAVLGAGMLTLALCSIAAISAGASPPGPTLSASVSSHEVTDGTALTVTGSLIGGGVGVGQAALALQADGYPFRGFLTIAHGTSTPQGDFSFQGVRLNRNTRLRVLVPGTQVTSGAALSVTVDPREETYAHSLGAGRTRLSLRLGHTTLGGSPTTLVWWFLAVRGTRVFHLAAVTQTRELHRGLSYASAIVDPPSRRFVYRVCLNPIWERAMGGAATHRPCPEQDFEVPHDVG